MARMYGSCSSDDVREREVVCEMSNKCFVQ